MRLLNASTLLFEEFGDEVPEYTILSHRWQKEEVTFLDISLNRHHTLQGWNKIEACCKLTVAQGYQYTWIDTCCIDKSSSAELTEAINSMYRWYQNSQVCYAYLYDVAAVSLHTSSAQKELSDSEWFTRGWTLQELIAPEQILFLNKHWQPLERKTDIDLLLEKITTIDAGVLCGMIPLSDCSIAQRMSWAAGRKTTRLEDRAYSLLGIFQVNMPMLYGEGSNAFRRLQEEIIKRSDDQSIFAWKNSQSLEEQLPMLAPNLSCFQDCGMIRCIYPTNDERAGYHTTNAGLTIRLMLIPWGMNLYLAPLSCGIVSRTDSNGQPCVRGYDRFCIFVRQTEYERHLVRTMLAGSQTLMVNSDQIATIRDAFKLKNRGVVLGHNTATATTPVFYGFEFDFNHPTLFQGQKKNVPGSADILCGNMWNLNHRVFEVHTPGFHTAGMFRLNWHKDPKILFMYFGFDLDFAPICLITSKPPTVPNGEVCDPTKDDLSYLGEHLKYSLLSLPWLMDQIAEGKNEQNLVAFRADKAASAELVSRTLSLKISFTLKKPQQQQLVGSSRGRWTVSFQHWEAPRSVGIWHSRGASRTNEDVFVTMTRSPRITAPSASHDRLVHAKNPYTRAPAVEEIHRSAYTTLGYIT